MSVQPEEKQRCPMHGILRLASGRWQPHIVWALGRMGPSRFGVLRRALDDNLSAKVLSEGLRKLERDGLVTRTTAEGKVPEVVYSLSEAGLALDRILLAIGTLDAELSLVREAAAGGS